MEISATPAGTETVVFLVNLLNLLVLKCDALEGGALRQLGICM